MAEESPDDVLEAFCLAYREGRPFDQKLVYEALCASGYGLRVRDGAHDQDQACGRSGCGHPYHRHFDPYEGDREVGCKYCPCEAFQEPGPVEFVERTGPLGIPQAWAKEVVRSSITIVEPVGNCDGSGLYKDDPSKEDRRGARLATRCPGCRACR